MAGSWRRLLTRAVTEEELKQFREHERTGRGLGSEEFPERLEKQLGRLLRRQKPRPK
jgi:putative transposase